MKLNNGAKTAQRVLSVGAAVMYALHGGRVLAADQSGALASDQGEDVLQEVLVTARRREEDVQKVPISITVVSADTLKENNIQSMEDLQNLTPSLTLTSSQDRDNPLVSIRGQGPNAGAGPAVVFYQDEVSMPTNLATGASVGGPGFYYDLDNIQVLLGPQGTLFGRNSTGGAVLVQSARPKDDFEGHAQLAYGNYNDREVDSVLNTPLIDHTLLFRVAVSWQERDGFTKQVGEPGRNLDDVNRQSARFSLRFNPNDSVQNDLIYSFADLNDNGTSALLSAVNAPVAAAAGYPQLPAFLAQQQALGVRTELPTDQLLFTQRDFWDITDILRVDVAPNVTFRNIFGYTRLVYREGADWDGTTLPIFQFAEGVPYPVRFNTYTDEPQLQGNALNGNLIYTAGALYLNSPAGDYGGSSTSILGSPRQLRFRQSTVSKGLYTQETYDLSSLIEGLKVTGGYRYQWEQQFTQGALLKDAAGQCPAGTPFNCITTGSFSYGTPTWNFDLDYQVLHDTMLYLAAKRGFRAGGFNLHPANPAVSNVVTPYGPEHLLDFELGVKSEWEIAGIKARTNFDAYYDQYRNIQVLAGTATAFEIQNVAGASISGVEFQGQIEPTDNWQLGVTYSEINFSYTGVTQGEQLPGVQNFPKNKYSINTKYRFPTASSLGNLSVNANWGWQSDNYIAPISEGVQASTIPFALQKAYGLLTLGLNWDHIRGGPLDASFFMTNALNKTYEITENVFYTFTGTASLTYGLPRMFGGRLNYRF